MGDTGKGYFELFDNESTENYKDELNNFLKNIPKVDANDLLQHQIKKFKNKFPDHGGIFSVGEKIEIKGSLFEVSTIDEEYLHLKLLKKE